MENCEILLYKKADRNSVLKELAEKLNCEINDVFNRIDSFAESLDVPVVIYVSDDNCENNTVSEVINAFETAVSKNKNISLTIKTDEFLNLINSNGHITHKAKPRTLVHRDGDFHPTVHIWVVKKTDMGIYVLLQKRASCKDLRPDCFDVSSAGHVTAGTEYRDSAARELFEELGIKAELKQLEFIGMHSSEFTANNVCDKEISAVYLYREPVDIKKLTLQQSEVAEVHWVDLDECLTLMGNPDFKHCISIEELKMIRKTLL